MLYWEREREEGREEGRSRGGEKEGNGERTRREEERKQQAMIISTHSEDISVCCLKVERVTDGDDSLTRETVVGDGEWEVSRGVEEVLKSEGKLSMGALWEGVHV